MKRALLVCALGVFAALAALPAHADTTFDLTFDGCLGSLSSHCYGGTSISSDGTIQLTVAGTPTVPTSIFGINSYSIDNDISGSVLIGGNTYTIEGLDSGFGSLSGFAPSNDLLLDHAGDYGLLNLDLSLSPTSSGTYDELLLNLDIATGEYTESFTYNCGTRRDPKTCTETYDQTDYGFFTDTINPLSTPPPSSTPEPGSLALLGTAILGGAGALRRRFTA